MKRLYTLAAAALVAVSALAAEPQILTPANGAMVPCANPPAQPLTLQRTDAKKVPARGNKLSATNLSGTYIDCFTAVNGIKGRQQSRTVTVTQDGTTVWIDGIGGFGQESLAESQFTWLAPIKFTIDLATGKMTTKMGQRLAVLTSYDSSNIIPYVGLFEYLQGGAYLGYGNYEVDAAHVEGDRIVFDFNPVFLWFSGSVPGSMTNSPIDGEFSPIFHQANGVLSYMATDQSQVTKEYSTAVWYEYGRDSAGNHTFTISNVYAENGCGYNIDWTFLDDNTLVATDQVVWGTADSPYYLQARSQRGQFSKIVAADVTERHNIKWPTRYNNTNYTTWTIKNNITGDYLTNNEPATVTGLWHNNYPTLCVLNDHVGWDPSRPLEVNTTTGLYEFVVPAGINEFALSTVKGANDMDTDGYVSGLIVTEMIAPAQPGQTYYLISGSNIDTDVVTLPDHDADWTVIVDIDFLELRVVAPEPPVPAIAVTFEGMAEAEEFEADATSGIYSFQLPAGSTTFTLADPEGTNLVIEGAEAIADNTGSTDYTLTPGEGSISVAYPDGQWTIFIDLEGSVLWATNDTEAPVTEVMDVYFDNEVSGFEAPYVHYSTDNAVTFSEPVPMTKVTDMPESAPARVLFSSATADLYTAAIPADATHVYFSDGGDDNTSTNVFEAEADAQYNSQGIVGISAITDTPAARATFYTLQGVRIERPAAGSVVVRVAADGRATKVCIR